MSKRSFLPALVAVFLLLPAARPASAQSVEKRLGQVETRVAQLRSQLNAVAGTVQSLPAQVAALTIQVSSLQATVATLQAQVPTLASQAALDVLTQRVAWLEAQVASLPGAPPLGLVVDCASGGSIQAALAQAGDRSARVEIEIVGTCAEDVHLSRSNTHLRGRTQGDGFRSLTMYHVHSVFLSQLTFSGGGIFASQASWFADHLAVNGASEGVRLENGSTAVIQTFSIEGSLARGLTVGIGCLLVGDWGRIDGHGTATDAGAQSYGGVIQLGDTLITGHQGGASVGGPGTLSFWGGSIQGNVSGGIGVSQGGRVVLHGTVVQDNGWLGICMDGGQAELNGAVIRRNGMGTSGGDGGGIRARMAGALSIRQTSIVDNGRNGIEARDLSSLLINGATISGNQGDGIILGSLSMMEASGETNTVSDNAGWGLTCASSARYRDYRTLNLSGNGAGGIAGSCVPE